MKDAITIDEARERLSVMLCAAEFDLDRLVSLTNRKSFKRLSIEKVLRMRRRLQASDDKVSELKSKIDELDRMIEERTKSEISDDDDLIVIDE